MGRSQSKAARSKRKLAFVDAFAGCGGLSLGLFQAGLQGQFAIEHDKFAFDTLKFNLLDGNRHQFAWPAWLAQEPMPIATLLQKHLTDLLKLKGKVDLLVGGPPCQGFSSAGRRDHDDPRNKLFQSYLKLVQILEPQAVLIENVRGFTMDFQGEVPVRNYAARLRKLLSKDYEVHAELLNLAEFGVPQQRTRYFLLALKPGLHDGNPFDLLRQKLPTLLRSLGLQAPISSSSAICDLEVERCGRRPSAETPGFDEIDYAQPLTRFQKLMHEDFSVPGDLRLARHSPAIADRFQDIISVSHAQGRLNTTIGEDLRARYGLKKMALRVLDPDRPAPTVTSMPDDLLHYSEPRTLTVRENARLQSFPDWFKFRGKYTTGGHLRRKEVPRFTQVANAVPPLAARAFGELIKEILIKS